MAGPLLFNVQHWLDNRCGRLFGWREVRVARIPKDRRDSMEQFGPDVLAQALAQSQPHLNEHLKDLVAQNENYYQVVSWLQEQRDRAERKEQRTETIEIAILIFVIIGVVADGALAGHDFGWLH
jgi:hypothetical protein